MRTTCFAVFASLVLGAVVQSRAVAYEVTDLTAIWTNLGYTTSYAPVARAVSPDGDTIVGNMSVYDSSLGTYCDHAFKYSNGQMTDIQPAAIGSGDWWYSVATDVNNAGQVAGRYRHNDPNETEVGMLGHAFLYSSNSGAVTTSPCNQSGEFVRVNASGQVSGSCVIQVSEIATIEYANLWSGGTAITLAPLSPSGASSQSFGINDNGWVVGDSDVSLFHAFVNRPDGQGGRETIDLGLLPGGGPESHASAINNAGTVVGQADGDMSNTRAFRVTPDGNGAYGPLQDLGSVSNELGGWSVARAINQDGLIVGQSSIMGGNSPFVGFLYDDNGMHNLNDLLSDADKATWTITDAIDVTDDGQILAVGKCGADPSFRYVFLSVPEPSTVVLLTIAAAGLLGFVLRWRTRLAG